MGPRLRAQTGELWQLLAEYTRTEDEDLKARITAVQEKLESMQLGLQVQQASSP